MKLNIKDALLAEHSKKQCNRIVKHIGSDQVKFAELMRYFFEEDYRLSQRAAWPVSFCALAYPELIKPYINQLIKGLSEKKVHPALLRNTLRIFEEMEIPRRYHGRLMDACFGFIASHDTPVAIKAYALTILKNFSKNYPDILPELKLLVQERWEIETAAFRSRAKKLINNN